MLPLFKRELPENARFRCQFKPFRAHNPPQKSKNINKNLNDLKLIFLELAHLGLYSGKVWENRFFSIMHDLGWSLQQTALKYFNVPVLYSFLYPGLSVSVILNGLDYNQYLGKLLSFLAPVLLNSGRGRFVRCWHASTDGSAASTFHSNCDGKGPTVTIIKSGSYIFGAYTDVSWQSKYHSFTSILMQML